MKTHTKRFRNEIVKVKIARKKQRISFPPEWNFVENNRSKVFHNTVKSLDNDAQF
jgi:hypothetical protein